ncbi:MAG: alpha/beta fold hydrolase [Candidatus Lokiarchaeota archaeon]|nr:alpha/beta fold hydrolase [Candidatus Lokiarchaeota archaeon]
MKLFTYKSRKILLIILFSGIFLGFFSIIYFHYILPNSYHYNTSFETEVTIDGTVTSFSIDGMVYEPKKGLLTDQDSEKRPLAVLIHGFAMSKEFMRSIGIELARRGITSISISMPGHGFSDAPYYFTNVSTQAAIDAIDYMMSENSRLHYNIDESKIGLIGHSMGAMTVIKAGFLDSRVNYTIAIAPPSGTSDFLAENDNYELSFGGDMREWVDLTKPSNLLLIRGEWDEAVYELDAQRIMQNATGESSIEPGILYGDFSSGTARQYNRYPFMDHATESFDPRSVTDMMKWIASSYNLSSEEFNGDLNVYPAMIRPLLFLISIVSAFLLFMPLSSYLAEKLLKKTPSQVENEILCLGEQSKTKTDKQSNRDDLKKILKILGIYFLFVTVIPSIIGQFISFHWTISNSMIADAAVPVFFISGLSALLILLIDSKTNKLKLDLKKSLKEGIYHGFTRNAKYILYLFITLIFSIGLVVLFWTLGLFNMAIPPYNLFAWILCILMIVPISFINDLLLRREIYKIMRKRTTKWKARLITPIVITLTTAFCLSITLAVTVGAPILEGILLSFIFWFFIVFLSLFIIDFPFASWSFYAEGTIYASTLIPPLFLSFIIFIFPIASMT